MSAQYALRPVEWCDLPALKRWRGLPEVQRHLRHPRLSWPAHLKWWWSVRAHQSPSCQVWAVVQEEALVGVVGWYYRHGEIAEASVLSAPRGYEDYAAERAMLPLLEQEARGAGIRYLYAEVLTRAPLKRHGVFVGWGVTAADTKSTIYKRVIA